jgi:methylglutaconyl-CoA hydratase
MNSPLVLIDTADPQLTVLTLNRPEKRNALSVRLMEDLAGAVRMASDDRHGRVLVLRGAGKVFCAGLDLREAASGDQTDRSATALSGLYEAICLCPLVTIAQAQGAAIGGGVGLLAACDLVVASEELQVGFPEVRRGLVAALVTALLARQLPQRLLRELILLGQTIPAQRALSIGMVNRVVPLDRLGDEVHALAEQALKAAPVAIARTKLLFDELCARPVTADLRTAMLYHLQARDDSEAAEGIAAFLEGREPRWSPRPHGASRQTGSGSPP